MYKKLITCGMIFILCNFIIQVNYANTKSNSTDKIPQCRRIEEYVGMRPWHLRGKYKYEYLKNGSVKKFYYPKLNFIAKIYLALFLHGIVEPEIDIFENNLLKINYYGCNSDATICSGATKYEYDKDNNLIAYNMFCDSNLLNCKYSKLSKPEKKTINLYEIDENIYKNCEADKCEYNKNGNITKKTYYKGTLAQLEYPNAWHNLVVKYKYTYDKYSNIVKICDGYGGCNTIKYECQ